ncbi:dihydrodipicolinate synthase family protein [Aquabacterium sp.]|uniref:dihydrodipicolinate synthase family protein n=1 Tax=Aquabacterium sp. TaxID=1872578 RepID=UPI003784FF67
MKILLPQADGRLAPYTMKAAPVAAPATPPRFNRIAYAAAHVVIDPLASTDPWDAEPAIDWDATLAFRDHLHGLGFRIAEAMDTAQRGMGLGWPSARELIRRSLRHAAATGAELACGVGTDQLAPAAVRSLDDVERAYQEQLDVVESEGGRAILMASRALAAIARDPVDYATVYGRLLGRAGRPVILHWLGEMFDPALAGYWGRAEPEAALDAVAELIERYQARIDGIKISLLDARLERALRARLPEGVRLYTGDDFNYAELIEGDAQGFSHALLGIFDPIAPAASAALAALAQDDRARYRALLAPTVALSREIFRSPTRHYKTGVVLLAWLNGHQRHFSMAGGAQSARSVLHAARVFELADACGVLRDPALACHRMRQWLQVAGGIDG